MTNMGSSNHKNFCIYSHRTDSDIQHLSLATPVNIRIWNIFSSCEACFRCRYINVTLLFYQQIFVHVRKNNHEHNCYSSIHIKYIHYAVILTVARLFTTITLQYFTFLNKLQQLNKIKMMKCNSCF